MNRFNILDAGLDLSHHHLLEASAGTGKTFSIENIILRLLLEGDEPLALDQILAVTFTRAAVADMRMRVRENLRRSLEACKRRLQGKDTEEMPEFLNALFSQGEEKAAFLKKRLENALASFDRVGIYTIHAFCARMLNENMLEGDNLVASHGDEKDLSQDLLQKMAKDFLRTELREELVSPLQLEIVLKEYKSFERLLKALGDAIASIMPVVPASPFESVFQEFSEAWKIIKSDLQVDGEKLLDDFLKQAPHYKSVCDKQKNIHPDILENAERFSALFDKEEIDRKDFDFIIEQRGFWNAVLKDKKAKFPDLALHYPQFTEAYRGAAEKLARKAANPQSIFTVLAAGCQRLGQRILQETDQLGFNSLLKAMYDACKKAPFVATVRSRFKAVIIDEFQDTDPLQWDIFRLLFPPSDHSWGRLFLVGDPKQSIYAFRQADIYTYLSASHAIDEPWRAILDRNFRSEPSMVFALNALFDASFARGLFPLPRTQGQVDYIPVVPGGKVQDWEFDDLRGSVHASLLVKDKYDIEAIDNEVFPFIAEEIRRLHTDHAIAFSQFAVLVADRYQAQRLIDHLRGWKIPAFYQRAASLAESAAVKAMRELLTVFINPRDESSLKIALGGPVIGWTHHQVRELENLDLFQPILEQILSLRELLWADGFSVFVAAFMQTTWNDSHTIEEALLAKEGGAFFYNEWQHVCDWLIERHSQSKALPEQLINDLLELEGSGEDSAAAKIQSTASENAVKVLTIHSSKGLEFDVVFPIGLYKRDKKPSTLIPVPDGEGGYTQQAVDETSDAYLSHCEELDAEKMRQLYVALTRAKHRLYIPFVFAPIDKRMPSPIELFTARCGVEETSHKDLCERIGIGLASPFEEKLRALQANVKISVAKVDGGSIAIVPIPAQKDVSLHAPESFQMPGKSTYLKSYTGLAKSLGHISLMASPADFMNEQKSPHTLPAGSEAGILLHAILENISFAEARAAVRPADLIDYIRRYTKGTSFEAWERPIADIVFAALKTPLFEGVAPLAEISDFECYREMEFVFSTGSEFGFDGFLKGVVDLFFRYEGKYYLVDWKSNWLGPETTDYHEGNMLMVMEENDYFLQARIYQEALQRYLKLMGDEVLGGIAYVFLRGLSPDTGVMRI